jgi:formate-dependent phosphoribosylglycinamide formyltransferase (GAR transformylase)
LHHQCYKSYQFQDVTVIVPVATAHVGCKVAEAVGAAGVAGCALIVTGAEIHPAAFFAVTECSSSHISKYSSSVGIS